VSDSKRSATGGESVAFWFLLALWIAGFAGEIVTFARQWTAIDSGDLGAFSSSWLTLLTALLLLAAWVLAIVLAVRLRRWGWLVACVLLFVAVPVFAIAMLLDGRTSGADRRQQTSFEQAMAQALAEQEAERSRGGA
jgi:hypothetical protein